MNTKQVYIVEFAEYVAKWFAIRGEFLSKTRLQFILYYLQAWHLAYFDAPFFHETALAGDYGPFFKELYENDAFQNIATLQKMEAIAINSEAPEVLDFLKFELSDEQLTFLDEFLKYYGKKNAFELDLSIKKDKSWYDVAHNGLHQANKKWQEIPLDVTKNYYKKLLS
jgi:uncharacterized phage-associated protein